MASMLTNVPGGSRAPIIWEVPTSTSSIEAEPPPEDIVPSFDLGPSIQTTLEKVQSFAAVRYIAEQAEARMSFWGYRYVYVKGCEDSLPLDALAARVIELVKQNPHFDEKERVHGKALAKRIDLIYFHSDALFKQSNFFTRWLCALRTLPDFFSRIQECNHRTCSKTRWDWNQGHKQTLDHFRVDEAFEYYTKEQYVKRYQHPPDEMSATMILGLKRWRAKDLNFRMQISNEARMIIL